MGLEDTVFLASMGRSGSTFLSNLINHSNEYRVLFEPFRTQVVPAAAGFEFPTYLNVSDSDSSRLTSAEKILTGRVNSSWIGLENRTLFPKYRLIKDIRANFFLGWLKQNFPKIKIILLIRHPLSTIHSWMVANFGDGSRAREVLLSNRSFTNDQASYLTRGYAEASDTFERLLYLWCFQYFVPLTTLHPGEVHVTHYENILAQPALEMEQLFKFLNKPFSEKACLARLKKPSLTTNKGAKEFERKSTERLRIPSDFTEKQIAFADRVLESFDFHTMYRAGTCQPCPVTRVQ